MFRNSNEARLVREESAKRKVAGDGSERRGGKAVKLPNPIRHHSMGEPDSLA